jgi:hypothetical protein
MRKMDPQVRKILVDMKAAVSEGWVQGDLMNEQGGVCLYGALIKSANIPTRWGYCVGPNHVKGRSGYMPGPMWTMEEDTPAYHAMQLFAEAVGVESVSDLALWNDAKERTVDDITSTIDAILLKVTPEPKRNVFRRVMLRERESKLTEV